MANGKAGAPIGNTNHTNGRLWKAAVEHVVSRWPEPPETGKLDCNDLVRGLRLAALGFVKNLMLNQDIAFYREFGDRIDGKAHQSQDIEHKGNLVINTINYADAESDTDTDTV